MKEPRPQVSLRELNRWTLARQLLLERADLDPVTAIERLAGLQAQWPRSPYLALWSRLRDFRAETLESALVEGRVVKSNLMRVTLHLVSAAEFHLYRAAIETETQSGWSGSAAAAGESLAAIRAELIARATARPLPRAEALAVMEALAPGMDEMDRRRLWYLLKSAHLVADPRHALFRSTPQGDHVLAPTLTEVAHEVAITHLVRSHLAAFGPATRADTADWTGQTVGALLPGYAALADELVELTGPNGESLVDLRGAPRPAAEVAAPVRFLPKWDSLLLGHKRRTRVISDEHRKVVIRKNGDVSETFTVDGFVAGTWAATEKRGAATLTLTPFIQLPKPVAAALEEEGERLLHFLAPEALDVSIGVLSL
ncbi:MAG TPA: winged helix DNA-binding domain-containing protein [Candidatus Dormibacteraeota bacterium]|jgi:uncharacterized protein YcaQ